MPDHARPRSDRLDEVRVAEYKQYTFPVTNVANNAGAADPWGYGNNYPLDSITVQLERTAPLGGINGVLNFYGANDLAAGFGRSPIAKESISFGSDDDPSFDIDPNTVPASGSVTQSVTATFDVSVVPSKFFKAAIEVDAPNGLREEPVEEP